MGARLARPLSCTSSRGLTGLLLASSLPLITIQQHQFPLSFSHRPLIPIAFAEQEKAEDDEEEEEEEGKPVKYILEEKRQIMIEQYENKIRFFSTPEKVFNYFASVETETGKYMTFNDFVLSITPSMRRDTGEQNQDEEKSFKFNFFSSTSAPGASGAMKNAQISSTSTLNKPESTESTREKSSHKLSGSAFAVIDSSGDGLISFEEYLFCMTLLSIPSNEFRLAFSMFDLDGDETIDSAEFETVMRLMRSHSPVTNSQRLDKFAESNDSVLDEFFGKDRKRKMKVDEFERFISSLQEEILKLEFDHYKEEESGGLSAHDFINMVVCHSGNVQKYLDNIDETKNKHRISFAEFAEFNRFVHEAVRAEKALDMYCNASQELSRELLQRVCTAVCGVRLSPELVEMLFQALGAEDGENVNMEEMFIILRRRADRFLSKPKDGGFTKSVKCCAECVFSYWR